MKILRRNAGVAAVLMITGFVSWSGSLASPITKPIHINIGMKTCWKYSGRFGGFVYSAKKGDRLLISAAGGADFGEGSYRWASVEPRTIIVARGEGEIVRPEGSGSVYHFDEAGEYTVTLYPASIHGMRSMVIACQAPPEAALGMQ